MSRAAELYQFARSLHQLSLAKLMQTVVEGLCQLIDATGGYIVIFYSQSDWLAIGTRGTQLSDELNAILLTRGAIGYALHSQRIVIIRNIEIDPRWIPLEHLPNQGSAVALPLWQRDRIVGMLLLAHPEIDAFDQARLTLLDEAVELATIALMNAVEHQRLIQEVALDLKAQMELEQLRRDLAAMVYHDLRNPLQTVIGSMQRLARLLANHDDPIILTIMQTGLRSSRQLSRLIESLLDVQRLEEGNQILNRKINALSELLTVAVELVQPMAWESGQRIKFEVEDRLPSLRLDGSMIQRVVINLLENAVKYTPEGGTITLRAYQASNGRQVIISVKDSGPGIPHHLQEKIFDKFSRVKYHDAPQGLGLGLAFCRLAIEAHHGEIWVESEPGQGADFIFTLPLNEDTLPAQAPSS
ncbi:MAG: ATP-binding protein [Anaerolineae bacterium]|jgi:K+-sensing histidine kinase KdpD|nr:ATP-binding protein [Anaerolineae bacterium]